MNVLCHLCMILSAVIDVIVGYLTVTLVLLSVKCPNSTTLNEHFADIGHQVNKNNWIRVSFCVVNHVFSQKNPVPPPMSQNMSFHFWVWLGDYSRVICCWWCAAAMEFYVLMSSFILTSVIMLQILKMARYWQRWRSSRIHRTMKTVGTRPSAVTRRDSSLRRRHVIVRQTTTTTAFI